MSEIKKKKSGEPRAEPFGRPSTYDPKYCQMLVDYFKRKPYTVNADGENEAADFPSLAGFACSIEINRATLRNWAKDHKDFLTAYNIAKDYQENFLITVAMKSLVNPAFAIFTAKNVIGWRDKVELSEDEEAELEFN